eukprot:jgi/Botrbrau1/5710/Bobra.0071s0041.1
METKFKSLYGKSVTLSHSTFRKPFQTLQKVALYASGLIKGKTHILRKDRPGGTSVWWEALEFCAVHMREKETETTYWNISLREYFEQTLGHQTLKRWHSTHSPGERMWIASDSWKPKHEREGGHPTYTRKIRFTQDLHDKAFLARIVGMDMMEVTDNQVCWYIEEEGHLHTVSNPHTVVPVLGYMNSAWLYNQLVPVVAPDGTPGVKAIWRVKADVQKAPYGLRLPLELFLWNEMQRSMNLLLDSIQLRVRDYIQRREQGCPPPPDTAWPFDEAEEGTWTGPHIFDSLSDWHDAMSCLSDMEYIASSGADLAYLGSLGKSMDSTSNDSWEEEPSSGEATPPQGLSTPSWKLWRTRSQKTLDNAPLDLPILQHKTFAGKHSHRFKKAAQKVLGISSIKYRTKGQHC